jgi:elongation factor P--beta-lysine ligase
MSKAFYNDIAVENWTCANMIEYYRVKSGQKDLRTIMDRIKKDLQVVADSTEFEIMHRKEARKILDDWKVCSIMW